jgi:hypothetical protein
VTVGESKSETRGRSTSVTHGESTGRTQSIGLTTGTTVSSGFSEGIEPIHASLPSAVHSKDNALYFAAQELLSLPTGAARIAYVGQEGRAVARVRVPRVSECRLSDELFEELRAKTLTESSSAIPTAEAMAKLHNREQLLIAEAKQGKEPLPEPETFRVAAPIAKTSNGNNEGCVSISIAPSSTRRRGQNAAVRRPASKTRQRGLELKHGK